MREKSTSPWKMLLFPSIAIQILSEYYPPSQVSFPSRSLINWFATNFIISLLTGKRETFSYAEHKGEHR